MKEVVLMTSNFNKCIGFVVMSLLFVACQVAPTAIKTESPKIPSQSQDEKFLKDFGPDIILDARSVFDFNLYHHPSAQNIQWKDFSGRQGGGFLDSNLESLSRRLSLMGIHQNSKVLVLGYDLQRTEGSQSEEGVSHGEEGRIAWMLQLLGVQNVRIASYKILKNNKTLVAEVPANTEFWKPTVCEGCLIQARALKELKASKVIVVKGDLPSTWRKAHLGKNQKTTQISWRKFVLASLGGTALTAQELSQMGIDKNEKIILLSPEGVESSAVAFVLKQWGFENVAVVNGGWGSVR